MVLYTIYIIIRPRLVVLDPAAMSGFLPSLHKTCSSTVITNTSTTANDNNASPHPPSPNSESSQPSQQSTSTRRPSISKSELSEHEDDDEDDEARSMNERAFSVVSFSIHRGPSITSVNSGDSGDFFAGSASTIRFNTSKPAIAGDRRSPGSGSGSGVVVCRIDSKDTKNARDANGSMKSLKNLSVKSIQVVGPETKKTRFGGFFRSSLLSSWWSRLTTRREQETQGQHGEEAKRPTTTTDNLGAVERQEQGQEQDPYPDGGLKAWLMVFGAMCNTFSTFGYVNSWGIFQAYYQTTVLSDSTPSNIAWIGSIQYSLVFLPGLITGRLFDLGYFHSVFLPCSFLLVLATFLVAECHVYWQFLLCQGFAVGVS